MNTKIAVLEGIRVIDFTKAIAGPLCGAYLADMGAEVIKIEPVGGDPSRKSGPKVGEFAGYFTNCNRGKRSMTLDMKSKEGKEAFAKLVQTADVLLENNRPGVMDRLGFGVEDCKKLNPNLIYCSSSGFGQTGPYALRPAFDVVANAMGGVMHITGTPETIPLNPGPAVTDVMTALNNTIAILLSLIGRSKTGIAQSIDNSLIASAVACQLAQSSEYLIDRRIPMREGSKFNNACPYEAFQASDGYFVMAAVGTWKNFCETIIERPDLAEDPRFSKSEARIQNRPALREIIEAWAADKTVAEIVEAKANLIPCAPVNNFEQVYNDVHIREDRQMFIDIPLADGNTMTVTNNPIRMSAFKISPEKGPSFPGGDNEDLLTSLGYDKETIADWRARNII